MKKEKMRKSGMPRKGGKNLRKGSGGPGKSFKHPNMQASSQNNADKELAKMKGWGV